MSQLIPFPVTFPALSISNSAVRIPTIVQMYVVGITGNLQALTSGSFAIDVRDQAGTLIRSMVWTSNGEVRAVIDSFEIPDTGSLRFDISGIGLGAVGPSLTVWAVIY